MSDWSILLNFLYRFTNELDFIHPSIFENLDIFFEKPKLCLPPPDYELLNHYKFIRDMNIMISFLIQNSECKEVITDENIRVITCSYDFSLTNTNSNSFNDWRSELESDPKVKVPQENLIIKSRRSGSNPDHNQK